jgi:hypothetical protein
MESMGSNDSEGQAGVLTHLEDLHNVGVPQPGDGVGLGEEAGAALGVGVAAGPGRREHLGISAVRGEPRRLAQRADYRVGLVVESPGQTGPPVAAVGRPALR